MLCRVLENFAKERSVEGSLLEQLCNLKEEEQNTVSDVVRALNPSANTLREILRLCDEIAARDGKTGATVLADQTCRNLLQDETIRFKDKQSRLKDHLEKLRYPELSRIYEELEQAKRELLTDCGLRFELPKDLEGDELSCSITLRKSEDCDDLACKFAEARKHPALDKIFSILRGDSRE